jgi:hypothetical protein
MTNIQDARCTNYYETSSCGQITKILEQVWKKQQEGDSCSGKVLVLVRPAD